VRARQLYPEIALISPRVMLPTWPSVLMRLTADGVFLQPYRSKEVLEVIRQLIN
jgi:hypothetical protein